MSGAKVERAAEATVERLKAMGAFRETEQGLLGNYMQAEDERISLLFAGMDVDASRLRQQLDLMTDEHHRLLATANAAEGGITPALLNSVLGGLTYQAMIFGWELAQ